MFCFLGGLPCDFSEKPTDGLETLHLGDVVGVCWWPGVLHFGTSNGAAPNRKHICRFLNI